MNVVDRAKKLVLEPQREWQAIDEETATVQDLFTGYVMILAAIPAVASFIGLSIVGIGAWGSTYRVPLGAGVTHLIAVYLMSLGAVYVLALVIEGLAPKFEGKRDFEQALKVAAYVPTPAWLAGIFNVIPALWIIGFFLSLYSLYLLFLGLPRLTRVPENKAIPFLVVVFIATIIICVAIYIVVSLTLPSKVRGF
jgi:Yip1-like protein